MEEYWFCGIFPDTTVRSEELTEEQEKIIDEVNNSEDLGFIQHGWLGYKANEGWKFMKHGMQVEYVKEERSNIARKILMDRLEKRFKEKK